MQKKETKPDYTGAIQKLLYDIPLYNYVNEERVNILVFGYSDISERFVDLAFEMAQVNGYKLRITVFSGNADAKKDYLKNRPAFCNFFDVDDQTSEDSYGTLLFRKMDLGKIEDRISDVMLNDESVKYAYLFVGTDDDALNVRIADSCVDCRELLDSNFVINCVAEQAADDDRIHFVLRDDSILNHKDAKALKAMAFNCHLVWNYSQLLDMRKLQRQFSAEYNYVACFSYVISLKYKLASIGVDFLAPGAPEAVDRLIRSNDRDDKAKLRDMIANEHKRWNVNMVCRGYRIAESLADYVSGKKSKANGYHACLVKGTGVQKLIGDWSVNAHEKWDSCSEAELNALDPLDRISVLLHREYVRQAKEIKRGNIMLQSDIDIILKLLEGYPKSKIAFDRFYICLQEISAGNSAKTALYDHYYSSLNKALNEIPIHQAKIVRNRIKTLTASFSTILESEKFIDYKQYDVDLIRKIPFILTYRSNLHIGIPIDVTDAQPVVNTAAFRTVEAALLINPSRITYICEYEKADLKTLNSILTYAVKCMDSHLLRSSINICLLTDHLSEKDKNKIKSVSARIRSVEAVADEESFVEYAKKRHLQIFEFTRTRTSAILERYDYCQRSHYKYNRNRNRFETSGCDPIKYIFFKPILKISDLFDFKSSMDDYCYPDMRKEYSYFWTLYNCRDNICNGMPQKIWKTLCDMLDKQNESGKITIEQMDQKTVSEDYLVESACLDAFRKLCDQAKKANQNITCDVAPNSNSSYLLKVSAPKAFHKILFELLCDAYKLYDPNSINIRIIKGKPILYYNSLNTGVISANAINEAIKEAKKVSFAQIKQFLKWIQNKGYIRNLSVSETDGISFSYCTHQIKEIMITAGRVLELYVYYKLLESGAFDDVANSVEIFWGDDEAENEIDIIATKGYKVWIIECKAQIALNQEYYNKLSRIDRDYGLNSVPVIVADTLGISDLADKNAKIMEIGKRVGIHTVFEKDKIRNELAKELTYLTN